MSLRVPDLDDVDFEQLVEEARGLIQRYAPDWTDHNLHDPGITLLELLAWITDQQVYQLGFVGDRHQQAFAALLGVRGDHARPAGGLVWLNEPPQRALLLEEGASAAAVKQPEIPFVVARTVQVSAARELAFEASSGARSFALRGFNARPGASFTFAADADAQGGSLTLSFAEPIFDPALGAAPVALGVEVEDHGAGDDAARGEPRAWGPIAVEYRAGGAGWQALEIIEDDTRALARTGFIRLAPPGDAITSGPSALRLRLDLGFFPRQPRIARLGLNALPITQVRIVPAGVLGSSNGLPDQRFAIGLAGLVGSQRPEIEVASDTGREPWSKTDDLTQRLPDERVYRLLEDADALLFGNGINGAIPAAGSQVLHGSYRLTLGNAGNLTAGLGWRIAGIPESGAAGVGTNPAALTGGRDRSSADQLVRAARQRAVSGTALLSDRELVERARHLVGLAVDRAKVLPAFHPALPGLDLPRTRTLAVVPKAGLGHDPDWRRAFAAALDQELAPQRVLGERLMVTLARAVPVGIAATLIARDDVDAASVREIAERRLRARLSDVQRDPAIEPWPLGHPVNAHEIAALLAGVPGVVAVDEVALSSSADATAQTRLELAVDEVAVLATSELRIRRSALH
jgi:hypothetical protein